MPVASNKNDLGWESGDISKTGEWWSASVSEGVVAWLIRLSVDDSPALCSSSGPSSRKYETLLDETFGVDVRWGSGGRYCGCCVSDDDETPAISLLLVWLRVESLRTVEHSTAGRTNTVGRTSDCTRLQWVRRPTTTVMLNSNNEYDVPRRVDRRPARQPRRRRTSFRWRSSSHTSPDGTERLVVRNQGLTTTVLNESASWWEISWSVGIVDVDIIVVTWLRGCLAWQEWAGLPP